MVEEVKVKEKETEETEVEAVDKTVLLGLSHFRGSDSHFDDDDAEQESQAYM